jgi:hypothetical protein
LGTKERKNLKYNGLSLQKGTQEACTRELSSWLFRKGWENQKVYRQR